MPFFASCTTGDDVPAQIINKPTTFSQEYPNLPEGIYFKFLEASQYNKVIAKFPKEVSKVIILDKDRKSEESTIKPDGKYWIDYLEDKYSLKDSYTIIGIPKDGSQKLTYNEFTLDTVWDYYTVRFDPHEAKEQELTINDKSLTTTKALMDINGKLIEMKKDEKDTFRIKAILPQSPCAKVYLFNKDDKIVEIIDLKMALAKEHRKYYCPIWERFDARTICSTDINGADFRLEYLLDVPKPKFEEEKEYEGYEFRLDGSSAVQLISLSKDARYFFLTSEWRRHKRSDANSFSTVFVNGRRVQRTILTEYLIFDSKDRSYHTIGTHYRYELFPMDDRGPSLIEKGNLVLPVKWYEDRVVCSLVSMIDKEVRDGETKTGVINFETGVEDAFSPYATAKGIEIDLSSYEYKDTEEFKPLSPFMSFADDSTGIIGYVDIFEKSEASGGRMSYMTTFNQEFRYATNYFTDYSQKNVYKKSDLANRILPEKYKKDYELSYHGSRIENNSRKVYFLLDSKDMKGWRPNEIPESQRWADFESEHYSLFFSLDIETGKIEKIFEKEKKANSDWEPRTPYGFFILFGSGDMPTNTWVGGFREYWATSERYGFELRKYDDKVPMVFKNNKLIESQIREKQIFDGIIR